MHAITKLQMSERHCCIGTSW